MIGPFVHQIDPVIGQIGGIYIWYYGMGYSLGFLAIHSWFKRQRRSLGLSISQVYTLSIAFAFGVLAGGRLVEVFFYEWPFYSRHPAYIPAYWLGGMSTHGILLGAIVSTYAFCRMQKKSFLRIADEIVIPGAFLMGVGRLGNFIDGQIVGAVTDVWWAVKFPDAEGFRHPVVLYDGLKNLLLIPLLLWVRRMHPPRGVLVAHFVFWYGFLRIFIDIFREYPTTLLGIATGQSFNVFMSLLGAFLLFRFYRSMPEQPDDAGHRRPPVPFRPALFFRLWQKRIVLILLFLFPLCCPSDWTQDIPARYGDRHPGMQHSALYPPIQE